MAGAAIGYFIPAEIPFSKLSEDERASLAAACGTSSSEIIDAIEYAIRMTYCAEVTAALRATEREVAMAHASIMEKIVEFIEYLPPSDRPLAVADAKNAAWSDILNDPDSRDDLQTAMHALLRLARRLGGRATKLENNASRQVKRPPVAIQSLFHTIHRLFGIHGISTALPSDPEVPTAKEADTVGDRSPIYRTCRLAVGMVADRLASADATSTSAPDPGAKRAKRAKRAGGGDRDKTKAAKVRALSPIAFCRLIRSSRGE